MAKQATTDAPDNAELIPLSQAGRHFPRNAVGSTKSYSTLSRWVNHGVETHDGRTVKLGVVRVGVWVYTTKELIDKFIADCSGAAT